MREESGLAAIRHFRSFVAGAAPVAAAFAPPCFSGGAIPAKLPEQVSPSVFAKESRFA
jgi:hypothetical protein